MRSLGTTLSFAIVICAFLYTATTQAQDTWFMDDDGTVKSHRKITDSQGDFTCTLEDPCLVGTSVSAQGDLDSDGEGMVDLWESPNDMDPPARATRALPTPITYIYDGIGTGILGGSPFTNAVFTITALADTDNIAPWPPATGGPQNTHLSTLIDIAGLGSFSITTPSHSWMTGSGSGREFVKQLGYP